MIAAWSVSSPLGRPRNRESENEVKYSFVTQCTHNPVEMTGFLVYVGYMRLRSKKKVLEFEDVTHPFTCVFIKANCSNGVFIGVNGKYKVYPINVPVALTRSEYGVIRGINKERGFYDSSKHDYDPFV